MGKFREVLHAKRAIYETHSGPKSLCVCGHAGDGYGIDDDGTVNLHAGDDGHGACVICLAKAPEQQCERFRWAGWTDLLARKLNASK